MRKEDSLYLAISRYIQLQYPSKIYHFDTGSGAFMSKGMAKRNKAMNPHNGWPDLFIPPLLFIEIKAEGTDIVLKDGVTLVANEHVRHQAEMLQKLSDMGFIAVFGIGFDHCKFLIDSYFAGTLKKS